MLTKGQQDFIGSTFPTPKGGILTVVGVGEGQDKRGRWDGKYILHCSKCSRDKELWPYGSLTSPKGSLKKGIAPCDCAIGKPRYTERQDILTTNRELESVDSTLRVISIENSTSTKRYVLTCSICSNDKELWPEGSITSVKGSLRRGMKPCGCAPTREYTEDQDKIRVQRLLNTTLPNLKVKYREKVKGQSARFILECSECSKDTELWPTGSISSVVGSLKAGLIPCGCSKSPQWSESQYKILSTRKAQDIDLRLVSFWSDFKGLDSEITVSYNGVLKRVILKRFLYLKDRNPIFFPFQGTVEKLRTSEEDIMKMSRSTGLHFKTLRYIKSRGKEMEYTCKICSEDIYTRTGLCSGKFKTSLDQIKEGNRSCRCSPTYRWTKAQQEFKIKSLMKNGEEFLYWSNVKCDGEITSSSLINWKCNKGHKVVTSQSNFINKRSGCRKCYTAFQKEKGFVNGYYPERAEEQDNLYVIAFHKDNTIKVGRAFDLEARVSKTSKCLLKVSEHSIDEITILKVMKGSHQEVYDTEQWVHEELTERGFHAPWITWTQECFTEDSKTMIELLLKDCGLEDGGILCQT